MKQTKEFRAPTERYRPPPNSIKMVCPVCKAEQWRWKGQALRALHKCFFCDHKPLVPCRGKGARGPAITLEEKLIAEEIKSDAEKNEPEMVEDYYERAKS